MSSSMVRQKAGASWVDRVQAFWFEELKASAWFEPNAEVDEIIRTRFLTIYRHVAADFDIVAATASADQSVASAIVLDQFPRNMFRGTALAFATDHLALAVARAAIDRNLDHDLDKNRRLFLYMPFEHSEDTADQQRAVELIGGLDDGELFRYAVAHRDIIARYGRFPHRNVILGRTSTPEEKAFLDQSGDTFYLRRK
jgi:uncharacterized protein (DUF924 family)